MNSKRGIKNLLYSILGQSITICLGIIIPRLFLVNFGSEVNGLLNSVNQIFAYFTLFEAGIGATALQVLYKPIADDDKNSINSIMAATNRYYKRTSILYLLGIVIFAFVFAITMSGNISAPTIAGVIIFTGMGSVVNFYYQGKYKILLQAEGKSYIITNIQTLIQIGSSVGKIICILIGFNIVMIQAVFFIVNITQIAYYYWYLKRHYRWIDLNVKPDYDALSQKNSVLIHQISGLVFSNTDVLILTVICGLKVVSVYSIYKLVVQMISGLTNNISNSLVFILGQTFSKNSPKYIKMVDAYDTYYNALCVALYSIACVLLLPFVTLYTRGVTDIVYVDQWLPYLFISIELLLVFRNAMNNTIIVAGHFKSTLPQTIIETSINLVFTLFLAFRLGIYGVLIGTIAALLYRTNAIIIYANKRLLERSSFKSYRIYLLNLILFLAVQLIANNLHLKITSYSHFFLVAIAVTVVIIPAFLAINSLVFFKEFQSVLEFIKAKMKTRKKQT